LVALGGADGVGEVAGQNLPQPRRPLLLGLAAELVPATERLQHTLLDHVRRVEPRPRPAAQLQLRQQMQVRPVALPVGRRVRHRRSRQPPRENLATASGFSLIPSPGPVGTGSMPSASSWNGGSINSSMYGTPVWYSTHFATGIAAVSARSAATPMAVF